MPLKLLNCSTVIWLLVVDLVTYLFDIDNVKTSMFSRNYPFIIVISFHTVPWHQVFLIQIFHMKLDWSSLFYVILLIYKQLYTFL